MKVRLTKVFALSGKIGWIIQVKRAWWTPWLSADQGVFLESEIKEANAAMQKYLAKHK